VDGRHRDVKRVNFGFDRKATAANALAGEQRRVTGEIEKDEIAKNRCPTTRGCGITRGH
jgi:hypothetical protein